MMSSAADLLPRPASLPSRAWLVAALAALAAPPLAGAEALPSRSSYAKAYGETKNPVSVDPAKDLPRYPAVPPAEAIATWRVKKGFKLELAAHEPQVRDPIAVCFDENGRMFVCEMIDYSEMRDATPHLGRISVLEDRDADGYFETSTVFADDLPWPTGLIWANGGLFVGATPDIWRFEDRDGDGRAEHRERVFTGFGTGLKLLNVQGLMNSFQWGQDNRIHVLAGGGNRGSIKCLKRADLPEQELGGRDLWFNPLTFEFGLEVGGAQYGMSFDNAGRKFGCSNSDHLQTWVYDDGLTGRNPLFNMPPSRRSIAADGGAAEVFRISPDEPWRIIRTRWRIAGVVKGSVEGGGRVSGYFTGASGTTVFRGDAYGPDFVNNTFTGDAGGQLVHRKIVKPSPDGISLVGHRPEDEQGFEFAASTDTWVRVVNFANAPDGCLHICDMYREVIEHPWSIPDEIKQHIDLNSGNDRGRIYRLVPEEGADRRGTSVSLGKASVAELVEALGHSNGWHRDTAARLLFERQDPGAVPALREALQTSGNPLQTLHALGALEGLKSLDEAAVLQALTHADARVRERGLILVHRLGWTASPPPAVWERLQALADDADPRVRFQLALLLANTTHPGVAPTLARIPVSDDWTASAVLAAPPELAHAIAQERAKNGAGFNEHLTPGLFTIIGARNHPGEVREAIAQISAAADPDAASIAALAQGLRRAGSSIEKADEGNALRPVFEAAAATMADPRAGEKRRLSAMKLMALAHPDRAIPALTARLQASEPEAVQAAAVGGLAGFAKPLVMQTLVDQWAVLKPKAREAALAAFLARKEGATALLDAVAAGKIPASDLGAAQVQALLKHKDATVAAAARKALASVIPPSREEAVAKFAAAAGMAGDAVKGQAQFAARCMACHRAAGLGIEVGPDLVTVKTKGREALLTAILEPHKEVASQFIAYTVATKDGQTLTGIITRDDATSLSVKMMGGIELHVQRGNVKGSSSAGQSLMPEGLEAGMSVADMADLLTFIEELK